MFVVAEVVQSLHLPFISMAFKPLLKQPLASIVIIGKNGW